MTSRAGMACALMAWSGLAGAEGRVLSMAFLLGDAELTAPVTMHEYARPASAKAPAATFEGSLRLREPGTVGNIRVLEDAIYDRVGQYGDALQHLPEFDFEFVQHGGIILPLERGVIRRAHPYWEIILQPGKAWTEAGDKGWTRASLPFALQERGANCTHNGVLTWLFDGQGNSSRAAYQVSSETCHYFKFDLWGVVTADYMPRNLDREAAPQIARFEALGTARLPLRPLAQLAEDYPGVGPHGFGVNDGIDPEDITVLGMLVDGVHYRGDCRTRAGAYPYCDALPLPSYSTAKSMFAAVALMRLERLYLGTAQATIGELVAECAGGAWRTVTLENALDMATGFYDSSEYMVDEYSPPHDAFVFADEHSEKIGFACGGFPHRQEPGLRFVYHSSDTYLVGAALAGLVGRKEAAADLYERVLVEPIWRRLGLSALLDRTKRTYDAAARPFAGYGLTYTADDIVRIADWLARADGRIDEIEALDRHMLDAALQRVPEDRGLATGIDGLRYNNGFWALDVGPVVGCDAPLWVPFMSGYGGITVAMFPNGVIYYYFSDSGVFRWRTAIEAAHEIKDLCN